MKRLVTFLLVAAMAASCMTACTPEGTQSTASSGSAAESSAIESSAAESANASMAESSAAGSTGEESTADSGKVNWQSDTTPITMKAFLNSVPNPTDWTWGQDPTSKKITELTGVTIENTYATTTDNTELNLLLASGEKLPDFIVGASSGAVRTSLVDQGFVLPLNKLADEHDPGFWDTLPQDMEKVYQEADGNFYVSVGWYGDASKQEDRILNVNGPVSFSIKKEFYEEIGSPKIVTLDDYADAITKIKEKHPEITNPIYDQNANLPQSDGGLLNVLARSYGATNSYFHMDGDNLSMVFMQPYYKEAMKAYNNLFQKGLINAEAYAYKPDQVKGMYQAQDLISYVGFYWSLIDGIGNTRDVTYQTIEFPLPQGKTAEDLKIRDGYFGIGSGGVYISKDTQAPDRAIKYIDFLQSETGQLLHRYGVEGVTWTPDANGRPIDTQAKIDAQKGGEAQLQRELGVYNYNFAWITSNWALGYGAEGTYANFPCMLPDYAIMTPHQQNERVTDLIYNISNTDEVALREQILSLWAQGAAKVCTSKDDAEFEKNYTDFIANMETAGVKTLEGYFQANAAHWKEIGLE